MRSSLSKASLLIATAAVFALLSATACGGGDEEADKTPAGGETPVKTQEAQASPLATRAVDFATACQKSDQKQWDEPPPMIIDPERSYTAVIKTEKGDITVELFPDVAPVTVNNFVFLACNGFYDDVTFHRVIPGFVAQAGDPTGSGSGGPGYMIEDEISDRSFEKGTVGMANRGPDTNGSQFFICYEPQPNLDGSYTIFGQVTAGFDVLEQITPRDPSQGGDLPPGDKILEITIEEG